MDEKKVLKKVFLFIFTTVIALLVGAYFSSFFANYIGIFDQQVPYVVEISPNSNEVVPSNITKILIKVNDLGRGIDFNNSKVSVTGRLKGNIDGFIINNDSFIVFSSDILRIPDIYTVTVSLQDISGNRMTVPYSSTFYVSQEPFLQKSFFSMPNIYPLNTTISGDGWNFTWQEHHKSYNFIISNLEKSVFSMENLFIKIELPFPAFSFRTGNLQTSSSCITRFPKGRQAFTSNESVRLPSCDVEIECTSLPSGSAYFGEIYVDEAYDGYRWFCNNNSRFQGSFFWNEFGLERKSTFSGNIS